MGRNKKANQRTKGNVKPSSSSKAAERLVQDGKTGFIGFGGLSEAVGNAFGYVPKSIGDEEDELSIDSELRMLMRKMGKKDTITRLKAVQEFSQLCSKKSADDVIKTLSFWPRIYNKLSEDYDHRVREAVQLAHLEIVTKAGRELAPQLKIIVSSWIKSQFDQYAPASSVAKKSFDITFPGDKKKGVISFCKTDLLVNMYDTLIKQTRDTLSDPRVTPEEERETKYNRLVSSTLLSFGYVMELLQQNDIADVTEQFENIFGEKKFWKFSKHSSPMIRTAFFTALSSACQYITDILRNHIAVLCPSVLCSLDESEPTVVRSFWECLLLTTNTFEECWNHVNATKAVLPKLWSVLRNGGSGSATVIFPNILPFLSKIPLSVIGEGIGFARKFFSTMKDGLFNSIISSQAESIAIMKAFMECLRYVSFNFHQEDTKDEVAKSVEEEKDTVLVNLLINEEIGSLVRCSISDKVYPWNTTFLTALRDLLIFAEKHSVENSDKEHICNQTISLTHSLLQNYVISLLNSEEEDYSRLKKQFKNVEELIKIVVFKMECSSQRQKRQVEFARNDGDPDRSMKDESKMATKENYIQSSYSRTHNLFDCTKALLTAVSSNCIRLLFERRNVLYLEFLSDILSCVNSNIDFQNMIATILSIRKSLEADKDIPNFVEMTNSYDSVIANIIQPIMKDHFSPDKSYWLSTDCQDAVIGLFCKMLIFLDETEKLGFLSSITKISTRPYMFSLLVQKVLSTIDLNASLSWFKTCDIWSQLITFTSHQCSRTASSSEEKNIFNSVFRCIETCLFFDNGSLYSEVIADKLFNIFKNHLASQFSGDDRMISERILALLAKFYSHESATDMITTGSIELLITIFQLMSKLDDSDFLEQANVTLKLGFTLLLKSSNMNHRTELENVLQKIAYWCQKVCFRTSVEEVQTVAFCCGQVVNFFNSDELEDVRSNYNARFLSQLTHSLGKYLQCTDFSSHTNLLDAVLLGTLSVNSLPRENISCQMINCSELNNALLVIKLVSSLKNFERDREIVVNALLDTICALCLVTRNGYAEGDFHMLSQVDAIETIVKEVLSMENIPSEYLLSSALNRALERGGPSTLALKKLLTIVPESIISKFPVSDLLGQAISHGRKDSTSLDALKVILSHVEDLSITRALVEQYVDQLCNEDSQTVESFNFALELCISALIRWQSMLDNCNDSSDDLDNVVRVILTHLIAWRDNTQDALLFSVDLADATDEQLALNVNLMKLISFCLDCGGGSKLSSDHWDFVLCSLASWIETCEENISTLTASYRKVVFTYWACNLCTSVSTTIHRTIGDGSVALIHNTISLKCKTPWSISDDWKCKLSNQISHDLVTEWQEFFSPAVFKSIYSLYKSLLDIEEGQSTMLSHLLKSICCSLNGMPSTLLLDIVMGNRTLEEQLHQEQMPSASVNSGKEYDSSQIEMIHNTYFHFVDHLNSKILCLQILAHAFLYKLMTVSYSVALSLTTESIEGDECDSIRSFPDQLMDVLEVSQDQILSYLDENSIGFGSYMQQPPTKDISRCILAFLLSWQINLRQFHESEAGYRASFANFIRKRNLTGPMMKILFSILPYDKGNLLSADPVVVDGDCLSLRHIHQLSFHLYLVALECIPAVIRSWCNNNLDKKSSIITERFTTAFASPILCSREIDQVSNSSKTFINMSIKTRPSAREVLATYSVEEISMELVVKMSPSHPLGPVTVECGKRVGVSSAQWRQWMLQLTMYLTQQNGAIVDGLALWKRNVDKKFEGVEECMICFSVVHGTNYQLPTIICRVCKKRFHSACLYKWFNTSNKSTCPLCRTSF